MNPHPDVVLESIRSLAPRWAARAEATDAAGRVPPETVAELVEAGAHRLLQPRRFGGAGAAIADHHDAVSATGEGCASTAWCLAVWSVHNWMLTMFDPQAQHEVWDDDPAVLISASIQPRNAFTRNAGGSLVVGGRFPFASGCDHAGWFLVSGTVADPAGGVDRVMALLPRSTVAIDHDSWRVMGLRGSGSKDFVVPEGTVVPAHRVVSMRDLALGRSAGQLAGTEPLVRAPFRPAAVVVLAPPALGAARAAAHRFGHRLATHRVGMARTAQIDDPAAGLRVAEASAEIDAAALVLRGAAARVDAMALDGADTSPLAQATVVRDTAFGVRLCAGAVDRLYESSGGSALADAEPLQRMWRDVHAARAHAVLTWDNAAGEYATAYRTSLG